MAVRYSDAGGERANFDLSDSLIDLHETLDPMGYWLIGLHAVAALFHHYFLKDDTLPPQ